MLPEVLASFPDPNEAMTTFPGWAGDEDAQADIIAAIKLRPTIMKSDDNPEEHEFI